MRFFHCHPTVSTAHACLSATCLCTGKLLGRRCQVHAGWSLGMSPRPFLGCMVSRWLVTFCFGRCLPMLRLVLSCRVFVAEPSLLAYHCYPTLLSVPKSFLTRAIEFQDTCGGYRISCVLFPVLLISRFHIIVSLRHDFLRFIICSSCLALFPPSPYSVFCAVFALGLYPTRKCSTA